MASWLWRLLSSWLVLFLSVFNIWPNLFSPDLILHNDLYLLPSFPQSSIFLDNCWCNFHWPSMLIVYFFFPGIELKHLCLEYMTPWLSNLVRFCKHNDDAKRQRVTAILDKLITMTINEKQMYPSIQAKIWGSLGQVLSLLRYLSSTSVMQILIWYPLCAKHCAGH